MNPVALFTLGLCFLFPAQLLAQDTVQLRDGRTESGRIESEDYKEVSMKSAKDPKKVLRLNRDDVVGISYGGSPDYAAAVGLVASGGYAEALKKLTALSASPGLRKELKQHVLFQLGAAQKGAGKWQDAITAMQELVKQFPKTPHLRAAVQSVVDARIALGDAASGIADVDGLAKLAKDGGVEDAYTMAFDIYRGRLLEAQKKTGEAKIKYEAAAAVRGVPASLTAEARLGVARCEQAEGKADKAKELYRALLDQDVGNYVLAGAWNGLGDLTRDEASKEKSADKLVDAVFMYLRGVVEFGPAAGESTGEYERALAGAGRVFQLLAELEKDEAKKKEYTQRANQRLAQLKKEFPNSSWLSAK